MAISYNIYANDGKGGDVNYATPIAHTPTTTFTPPLLIAPSDNSFAVRAVDATSGIEEANTDARVRIVVDAAGNDVTARPNPVRGLTASPTAGGNCWASWAYDTTGQGGAPVQFNVYLAPASNPFPAAPAATVAYLPGVPGYGCSLAGLAGQTSYSIMVRAVGANPQLLGLATTATLRYQASPLQPVDGLTVTASP